jgi:glycosyltransferase involved in cell wall biosynthesis
MSFYSVKPNVLILIAADIVSGPGKGLLQYLGYRRELNFDVTLCNFAAQWTKAASDDFVDEVKQAGLSMLFIKQNLPLDPLMVVRAIRIQRKCHTNIVQTHGYKPNVIGFFLKMILGMPWLAFAHGYTDDNPKIRVYNRIDQFLLQYANKVVAVSQATKCFLTGKGVPASKIVVIRNAIERTQILPRKAPKEMRALLGIESEAFVVGTVGRLNPEKGQIVFLKALKSVLGQIPQIKALIIGEGQDRQKLENYARVNGISQHVIFAGHVSHVADYYQIMDLLVIPSFSEGLPNVLLEGMAFGIPVIATSVGGIPEIISAESGVLVPPGDHVRLSEEISRLLRDRHCLHLLKIHAGESLLSSIDPLKRARRIVALYHNFLNLGRRTLAFGSDPENPRRTSDSSQTG